jgi:hypothetical protein
MNQPTTITHENRSDVPERLPFTVGVSRQAMSGSRSVRG